MAVLSTATAGSSESAVVAADAGRMVIGDPPAELGIHSGVPVVVVSEPDGDQWHAGRARRSRPGADSGSGALTRN
jgi:hypothetical protein